MPVIRWLLPFIVGLAGCTSPPHSAATAPADSLVPQPYQIGGREVIGYFGPERDSPPPRDIREVKIGWFGPTDPNHPTGGLMWLAAKLAIDEANQAGGYHGLPFRLLPAWSENPWGTGVAGLARLVYEEGVWAIAGAPDGPAAHLVAQVVAKARLTFISPVSSDPTTNYANVPWVFTCVPSYRVQATVLAGALISRSQGGRFGVVTATDHDSRVLSAELLAALAGRRLFPSVRVDFRPGSASLDEHVRILRQAGPAAVAILAGSLDSARFLCALRRGGWSGAVIGGPAMACHAFSDLAGESAAGVIFPTLWENSATDPFAGRFHARFGCRPDYTAAYTYDALGLLIAAIRQAGLNRALIRDAVRTLSPHEGAAGLIAWNALGQNEHVVGLGTITGGRGCHSGDWRQGESGRAGLFRRNQRLFPQFEAALR
jgi:branched-chain amino acid transport system substrate-binding protein